MTRARVIAQAVVPGWHCWQGAPPEVAYLGTPHRHLFTFRVEVVVGHDDRQVEFHLLRAWMVQQLSTWPAVEYGADGVNFGGSSCEALGRWLLGQSFNGTPLDAVEVWEDGECGARVERA